MIRLIDIKFAFIHASEVHEENVLGTTIRRHDTRVHKIRFDVRSKKILANIYFKVLLISVFFKFSL